MKTRNGFVSNSSSSSFVIALRNSTKKDELISPSDALRLCIEKSEYSWWSSVSEFLENEKFYIEGLEKSEKFLVEKMKFYDRVMGDKTTLEMAEEIGRVMRDYEITNGSLRLKPAQSSKSLARSQSIARPQNNIVIWQFSCSDEKMKLERELKTVRKSIESLKTIVGEVEKLKEGWDIVELTLDNMDGETPHRMEILEKRGDLTILRKEHIS